MKSNDSPSCFLKDLREHIPLQQGLRLHFYVLHQLVILPQRAYSITTRIKTVGKTQTTKSLEVAQRAYSITTRIKTGNLSAYGNVFDSESIFHYNKD